jgi:ATP-dependent RNA helicase DDX3X
LLADDWDEDLRAIFAKSRFGGQMQTLMFSATWNDAARELADRYLRDTSIRIEVGRAGSSHSNIVQHIRWIDDDLKKKAVYDLLFSLVPARTLVFVNSKRMADEVDDFLFNRGLPSSSIHAERTQREREASLLSFRKGTAPILVTTAVAARGIDIKAVHHVINFDLPSTDHGGITEYTHRIGRTGRIGNEGLATSFFNERNSDIGPDLVKLLIETAQPVPKFLAEFLPNHYEVEWEDGEEAKLINYITTPVGPRSPVVEATAFTSDFGGEDLAADTNEPGSVHLSSVKAEDDVDTLVLED